MVARWLMNLRVFLVWLLGFALAMVILILWHELVMVFVINTLRLGENIIPLIHILYYLLAGLLWFVFFLISMEYLKRSARKGMLLRGSLLVIGTQLLIIGFGQAGLTLYGYFPADQLGIILIAAAGLLGAGMLFFARHIGKVQHRIWLNQQN
ncbi:MAG: hypothetical protein JW730_13525 [Anaerolineales bacterium]|nr:hypothetical protein [Anaerolineales bacterium]